MKVSIKNNWTKAGIPLDAMVLELITTNSYCFSETSLFPKPPPNLAPF
jgi:hypothetical protein